MSPRYLERLLQIDSLLRTTQRLTTPSLAQELEVSERTIRSDLAFLRVRRRRWRSHRFHAPLEYSSKLGHHYTDPEWRLPSIPLTKGELFALTVGARMLEAYAGSPYALQLRSAIARLSERLQTFVSICQPIAIELSIMIIIKPKVFALLVLVPSSLLSNR